MKKFAIFTITIFYLSSVLILAQNDSNRKKHDHKLFDFKSFIFWDGSYNPFIEINYGIGDLRSDNFSDPFKKIGNWQIKLGHSVIDSYDESILEYDQSFFSLSAYSDRLKSSNTDNLIRTDSWQFGFGERTGYGYSFGKIALIPYSQRSMNWTKLIVTDNYYKNVLTNPGDILDPNNSSFDPFANTLNRFNKSFRFGTSAEAGINFQIASLVTIGAGYEFNTVYPRVQFWKAAGSLVLEETAQGLVSQFVDEIMDNSPAAGPIVSFFLKNGLAFAYYSLTKSDMNWPFSTEAPLTYETFKINLGFTF